MKQVPTKLENVERPRDVEKVIRGTPTSDGAGVKMLRVLTDDLQERLDPFLMLDAFGSDNPRDYIAGFPNHPHRGFETVTYMISGRMRHRDSAGNEGLLQNGGVQWMTAGRGLIHSELPEQEEGRMEGFQLWLNLPGKDKMCEPWYHDFQSDDIPEFLHPQGPTVRVIAGSTHGVTGAVQRQATQPLIVDIHFPTMGHFKHALPPSHNAFVYVYRGEVKVNGTKVPQQRMAILNNAPDSDGIILESDGESRVLVIAGQPLNEPIMQYGPFVMNTEDELRQAVMDFREGRFSA
jgi:redox-sensitive bicupin YhaK (pirin superfamily)